MLKIYSRFGKEIISLQLGQKFANRKFLLKTLKLILKRPNYSVSMWVLTNWRYS